MKEWLKENKGLAICYGITLAFGILMFVGMISALDSMDARQDRIDVALQLECEEHFGETAEYSGNIGPPFFPEFYCLVDGEGHPIKITKNDTIIILEESK